ncbi:DEAD/DEAH box helicase [Aureimonas altamirensis]|uniref:helicase-related protein n=1 Tax=Aureimonas altamirensis TaxID=370622 RepID=UPI0020375982|nr:helicase-related protein [Aureimonas altamirensis]MCM2503808.1 DEAD/DEAH box helicase [Aureimonas altamirensis]
MLTKTNIETIVEHVEHVQPLNPAGAVASLLNARQGKAPEEPLLYVATTTRRAEEIASMLRVLTGCEEAAAVFPRWDGFPEDGIPATTGVVGVRMGVLRWLLDADRRPSVVLTTVAALLRRVPPRRIWRGIHMEFRVGDEFDPDEVRGRLAGIGYQFEERVDAPGLAAVRGRVLEVFPAASARPCRIEYEAGKVTAIRSFDPASQRSIVSTELLIVDPAEERVGSTGADEDGEPGLARYYGVAESLFDYLPDCEILIEDGVERQAGELFEIASDGGMGADTLGADEWRGHLAARLGAVVEESGRPQDDAHVPAFAREDDPLSACRDFVAPLLERGYRFVLAGRVGHTSRLWARRLARQFGQPTPSTATWAVIRSAPGGTMHVMMAPLDEGFVDHAERIVVVSVRDLAGLSLVEPGGATSDVFASGGEAFAIGDAVVHFDHGVGILEGLECIDGDAEAIRLRYAGGATLLVPMDEIGALWRYGGSGSDVPLDRLKGEGWGKKRNAIIAAVSETAERMTALLREREAAHCDPIHPDRVDFERFCARFPYDLTPDQAKAGTEILDDLASGRPMDRLLCGDVGFGKTEIALRAAAAAVFSGRQVALVAPTTILAQQHYALFRKRFARHGVAVALLSRLQKPAEARAAKEAIADGTARILVATQAICGKGVAFADLALVVIDEEQRLGSRHKMAVRRLATKLHVLSMTATPIPRTLQAAFVGLHDVSVIATPPVRRRPVRTSTIDFDHDAVREALLAEKRTGGRSFVICPRIEDLDRVASRIRTFVPELELVILHGRMPAVEAERAMQKFATGRGDVLLATNIVENGVDIPDANTIVVMRPDRFGLAQLHQLRGRVGRGARRGTMLLALEPDGGLAETARERLETLERLGGLGSGFAISTRDLDMRGAGDLLGDDQAGHLRTIGVSLYRRMLERSLREARGLAQVDEWRPLLAVGIEGAIPADYLPEPELRIELASALDRVGDERALARLRDDTADRFGPMPGELLSLFDMAALRLRCRTLGIRSLHAGPKAVAATFGADDAQAVRSRMDGSANATLRWADCRLILDEPSDGDEKRWQVIERLLEQIA